MEPLRPHRNHGVVGALSPRWRAAAGAARRGAGEHFAACTGRTAGTAAGRCRRGAVYRRRRSGPRLPRPSGTDRRAFRRRSVRQRRAAVSHRRSGAPARRWRAGIPRPHRPAGEDSWLPHRAGRDRILPAGRRRGARGGGGRPAQPTGRLCGGGWRRGTAAAPAGKTEGETAGLYGPGADHASGTDAADAEPQAGPQGAAGTGAGRARLRRAAGRDRNAAGRHLAGGAGYRTGQRRGQLLRAGRRFHRLGAGGGQGAGCRAGTQPTRPVPAPERARPGRPCAAAGSGKRQGRGRRHRSGYSRCGGTGRAAGADRAGRGDPAAVADAAGHAVPLAGRAGQRSLRQPAGCTGGRPGCRALPRRLGRGQRAPRQPAQRLRLAGLRRCHAGDPARRRSADADSRLARARSRRRGVPGAGRRAAPIALRPRPRAAAAPAAGAPRRAPLPRAVDLPPPAAGRLEPVAADRPGAAPLPRPGAAGGRALPRLHRLAAVPRSAAQRTLLAREAGAAGRADAARPGAAGQAQRQRPPGHLHAARPRRQRAPEGLRPWSAGDPEHRGAGRLAAPAAALHRAAQRGLRRHGFRPAGVAAGGAGNPRAVHQHPADRAGAAPGTAARRLAARAAGLQPRRPRARAHAAQPDPALGRTRRTGAVRQHHRVRERAGGPPARRLAGRRTALRGGEGPRRDQLRHGPDGHPRRRPGNRIHVPPRVLRPGRGGGDPRASGASAGQLLRRRRTSAGADRHARWRGAARSRRGQPPAAAPVAAAGA
ncbi:hypothetical protein D9M70_339280 [compost metagenome]